MGEVWGAVGCSKRPRFRIKPAMGLEFKNFFGKLGILGGKRKFR